jgi:hypothetical protein
MQDQAHLLTATLLAQHRHGQRLPIANCRKPLR